MVANVEQRVNSDQENTFLSFMNLVLLRLIKPARRNAVKLQLRQNIERKLVLHAHYEIAQRQRALANFERTSAQT